MAITHVNSATGVSGTGSSLAVTVPSTTAGNLLVVGFKYNSTSATITSVTDNKGNTYAQAKTTTDSGLGSTVAEYHGVQGTGGATSVTVQISGSNPMRIAADEFSGLDSSNAATFDSPATGAGGTAGGSSASGTVSTFTPAASGELVVATYTGSNPAPWTAGTSYALGSASGSFLQMEYRLSGTTSETAPITMNQSNQWAGVAAAYKPPAAASTSLPIFHQRGRPVTRRRSF